MNRINKNILLIYSGVAFMYILLIPFRPVPLDFLIKAVPVLTLSFWLWKSVTGWTGKALSIAMLLSAGGDISLAIHSDKNPDLFIVGLAFFLLAHIVFTIVFSVRLKINSQNATSLILIPAYSITMAWVLAPHLDKMGIPVFAYIAVISVMGISAALNQRGNPVLVLGAILFVLSDSAIAINKFLLPVPAAAYFIMVTYYIAQYLIAWAFVKTEPDLNAQQPMVA